MAAMAAATTAAAAAMPKASTLIAWVPAQHPTPPCLLPDAAPPLYTWGLMRLARMAMCARELHWGPPLTGLFFCVCRQPSWADPDSLLTLTAALALCRCMLLWTAARMAPPVSWLPCAHDGLVCSAPGILRAG